LEYLLIALPPPLRVAAGTLAAALVIIEVMNLPFIWLPAWRPRRRWPPSRRRWCWDSPDLHGARPEACAGVAAL